MPILEHEAFPGKLLQTPNGETVLDFGQNIAGYVEMALTARAGQKVKLTCGEALDENGNFYTENLSWAKATDTYILSGGKQTLHPHFTWHGFRYICVEGAAIRAERAVYGVPSLDGFGTDRSFYLL